MSVSSYQRMENAGCLDDFQQMEEVNHVLLETLQLVAAPFDGGEAAGAPVQEVVIRHDSNLLAAIRHAIAIAKGIA